MFKIKLWIEHLSADIDHVLSTPVGREKKIKSGNLWFCGTHASMKDKILIIDDNHEFLQSIKDILNFEGYKVLLAQNGEQGLQIAGEQYPDLILCDIRMNHTDGFSVLKQLKKNNQTATIPLIYISAHAEESTMTLGDQLGAKGYLVKPFNRNELIEVINRNLNIENKAI